MVSGVDHVQDLVVRADFELCGRRCPGQGQRQRFWRQRIIQSRHLQASSRGIRTALHAGTRTSTVPGSRTCPASVGSSTGDSTAHSGSQIESRSRARSQSGTCSRALGGKVGDTQIRSTDSANRTPAPIQLAASQSTSSVPACDANRTQYEVQRCRIASRTFRENRYRVWTTACAKVRRKSRVGSPTTTVGRIVT